jgi:hypothetical protein
MAALKSQGVGIFLSDKASPEVYTEIPDVMSISGPDGSASEIDVTCLDSTAKEWLMGLPDEGTVSLELIWGGETGNTQQVALRTARANQSVENFQIKLTDSPQSVYAFQGYVTGWSLSAGVDDAVKCNVTIRITGAVTAS